MGGNKAEEFKAGSLGDMISLPPDKHKKAHIKRALPGDGENLALASPSPLTPAVFAVKCVC